jgi:putative ABC transport system permease protein
MRSRLRTLLVVLGIALGVGLYVATEAASDSMTSSFAALVTRISGHADLSVQATGLGVPAELLAQLSELPGIEHSAASIEVSTQAVDLDESLLVLGVDLLGDLHFAPFSVNSGEKNALIDPLSFVNDPSGILLSRRFAERHALREGSQLRLLTADGPRAFHVRGVLDDSGAAASFGGQVAVMFLDAAQLSFGRGTFADRIDLAVRKDVDVAAMQQQVASAIGKAYSVERPEQIGTRLRSLVEPLKAALAVSGFLALLVGAFLVYNAVSVAITQRRHEVGVLRALGVTRKTVIGLFMLESGLLAIPGVGIGLLLGQALAGYSIASTLETLNNHYAAVAQVAPSLAPALMLRASLVGLVVAAGSSFFPALRGTAFDPAIVLRGASAVELTRMPVGRMLLAAVTIGLLAWVPMLVGAQTGGALQLTIIVLCASLATPFFVVSLRVLFLRGVEAIFGIPGRLGLDYVERTLGRSTVNVLALMVAVGMSVSVGGWLGSFERSIAKWAGQVGVADLAVLQGSPVIDRRHVPLGAGAVERVKTSPGVESVQRFRTLEGQAGEVKFSLVATDTDIFIEQSARRGKGWELLEGAPLQHGALSEQPGIMLSENAARLLHVKAGDALKLQTPRGERSFPVRGVIVDYTSENGTGFIDLRYFHEYWADDVVDSLFVYLKPHTNTEAVANRIRVVVSGAVHGSSVFVTKTSEVEKNIVASLRKTFSYSHSVEVMTLIIALLGVIGTMVAAVIDRQREIGVLRAVGATRGQVAAAIMIEAGFLGFCAAAAGVLVGVVECRVFLHTLLAARTGWHLDFVFPWSSAIRTGALVVFTSALAGAVPAYRLLRAELVAERAGE